MIVKARIESIRLIDFDIPEFLAEDFEKEIELHVPQGQHVNYRVLKRWADAKGITLIPTDD